MRFTIAAVGAFAAVAVAQSGSNTKTDAPSATVSLDPVQSSMYACVDKCEEGDVVCQSRCIAVPAPNEEQVHDTNECFAKCDQGDGSQEQTDRYAACQQSCITKHYYVTSKGTPQATGAAGSNDDNNNNNNSGESSGAARPTNSAGNNDEDKEDSSKTSSGPASTKTNESEDEKESANPDSGAAALAGSSAALFGLIAAVFAL
jgi:hypothetical protein